MLVQSLGGEDPLEKAWQLTPVFLPGESHAQRSLAGYSPQDHTESDTTEVTQHARMHQPLQYSKGQTSLIVRLRTLEPLPLNSSTLRNPRFRTTAKENQEITFTAYQHQFKKTHIDYVLQPWEKNKIFHTSIGKQLAILSMCYELTFHVYTRCQVHHFSL